MSSSVQVDGSENTKRASTCHMPSTLMRASSPQASHMARPVRARSKARKEDFMGDPVSKKTTRGAGTAGPDAGERYFTLWMAAMLAAPNSLANSA